jgi:hypothetical protein
MNEHQEQPNFILKKRLNTFKNDKGAIRGVPNELNMDILKAWEQWTGSAKSFYQSLGLKKHQLSAIIKKGKSLLKNGTDKIGPFIPVKINPSEDAPKAPIILMWDKKRSIRFYQVKHLVEFLKEAA